VLSFFRTRRFAIDAAGFALSLVAFYITTKVAPPLVDMIGGVASSVLFAVGLDLLLALQGYLLHRRQQLMFGREMVRDGALFVYPDFVMNDEVAQTLVQHNQQMLYRRPRSRFSEHTTHRIDIPRVVASNDIRALLHVSDVFRANATTTDMVVDRVILDSAQCSFMSFGLSSNDCTHLYLEVDPDPMFEILPDDNGSEYVRMTSDGALFESTPKVQYGVVVRYAPELDLAQDRRWFLVAGLGPLGTTAAAKLLAKRWPELLKRVGSTNDFVLVVSTGAGTDDYPRLVALYVRPPGSSQCERMEK